MPTTKAKVSLERPLLVASRRSNRRMCTHDYDDIGLWFGSNSIFKKRSNLIGAKIE